ncbi:DUF484 family protein [Sulfitobacter sp. D35]|uniref:DUF484 family protein n=1 Tax=Sulfitobacter sp. D35 TaxID=3083252 RepID=UPI00296FAF22|nr:DUF484 family protein [Sulfitobacter sp. D35]MDW4499522.1 DUF484 family protein [Sulfitobacter sp. D35]
MSSSPKIEDALREAIITQPAVILDDADLMRALIAANEKAMGENIVDLRGIAMERLERRLDRLEDTHRSVIAAAYENLAGTNQIHRAILKLLDPPDFQAFLQTLDGDIAEILRVDCVRLVLESKLDEDDATIRRLGNVLRIAGPGFIDDYLGEASRAAVRPVSLRRVDKACERVYASRAPLIHSEACLRLDFGEGRLPGLLVLGARDHDMFGAQQGTDLLVFLAGVFERLMRRWLS